MLVIFNHRHIVRICALVSLLAGCATTAQREGDQIAERLQHANAGRNICEHKVNFDPAYAALDKHLRLTTDAEATLPQMTDGSKASPHEVALLSNRRSSIVSCRTEFVNKITAVTPTIALIWVVYYDLNDKNLVDLSTGKISWGEYISRWRSLNAAHSANLMHEGQIIVAQLSAKNQQEIAQRRAAIDALNQIAYGLQMYNQQQQIINNMNRPTTTHCNSWGGDTTCTTY